MLAEMQLLHGLGINAYLSSDDRGGVGGVSMKSSHHFRDQLSVMSGWFEQWNRCEQTVALFSLIQKIEPPHARFLALVLQQDSCNPPELAAQETQANDPAYISSLSSESKEAAVSRLLSHLPLLRPGNREAKDRYLQLIPKVLAHSIRHGVHIEESRQLLSYSLIHPAISNEDRLVLTQWLRQLEDRIHFNGNHGNENGYSNPATTAAPPAPRLDLWRPGDAFGNLGSNSLPPHVALHGMNSAPVGGGINSHPDGTQTLPMLHSRVRRSLSLTPPGCSPPSEQEYQMNGGGHHAPLSPQSSVTSSGSGSEERDTFNQDGTGMRDVPCWLKGLRLHKYAYIFKSMTYEEMMSITEEKLEKMNITKGARHKIVLSIQKLCERQSSLRSLEKDIQEGEGTIRSALNEIKGMLQTPIKAFRSGGADSPPTTPQEEGVGEGDIPGQITRLLGKICASLLISQSLEEDLNFFGMITDKCLSHEAFSPAHKRRLFTWKQQIQKACHPLPPRRSLDTRHRNKWNGYHPTSVEAVEPAVVSSLRRRLPVQFSPQPRMPLARQVSYTPHCTTAQVIKRPSLQDHMKPHVQIQRTNSAPVRPNPLPASIFGKATEGVDSNDPELNIRLESLCLSVTEHALGSFDGAVPLF